MEHYYENHVGVVKILTEKYGFKYTGIGDNYEECFYKDSDKPERIFIHPMHCSYSRDSSREFIAGYEKSVCFGSEASSKKQQKRAFEKLCSYLDNLYFKIIPEPTEKDLKDIREQIIRKHLQISEAKDGVSIFFAYHEAMIEYATLVKEKS